MLSASCNNNKKALRQRIREVKIQLPLARPRGYLPEKERKRKGLRDEGVRREGKRSAA